MEDCQCCESCALWSSTYCRGVAGGGVACEQRAPLNRGISGGAEEAVGG